MARQKEDPAASTHFMATHQVGAFAKGTILTAEQVRRSFGRDKDATPEEHEAYQAASLKRLLDGGAIIPAEAPEEPDDAAEPAPEPAQAPQKSAERDVREDEHAARQAQAGKRPEPPVAPKK